jgi:aminopeptidase N
MKKLLLFFILLVFVFSVYSQTERKNFNRIRTFDVQHYIIRTSFNHSSKTVYGDTTVSLKPLQNGFKTLELDAADLQFESVKLEPSSLDLNYRTEGEKVIVTLDKTYSSDELISVRFKYSAQPQKGIYFVEAERQGRKIIRDVQIWTQGETEEAHHWFPSFDFPDDKATTEQYLTVFDDETAIANGELVETIQNEHGTKTFHYKMTVPHSIYLVSFVIGKYVKISDRYKNIPLGYYVYPGKESIVPKAYGKTKDMFRIFEELTGVDFPYNKYDQTIVAKFNFGGMENITATTMGDDSIFFVEFPFGKNAVEDLVAHELAHSWFGNLVTCRNWAELWLNEGFATFMEAAYREKMYGRADYMRKIKNDAEQYFAEESRKSNKHGLFNQLARADDSIFNSVPYQKGGTVIHTLREQIGDEAFWKAVNIYLNRHKFENVETPDLQKVMEETSKQDLDWFFNQWVYGIEYPKLEIMKNFNPRNGILRLTVKQTQTINNLTPEAFTLPLEVEVKTAKGVKTERITVTKRMQTFSIKAGSKPLQISFDKNGKIPLKSIKQL